MRVVGWIVLTVGVLLVAIGWNQDITASSLPSLSDPLSSLPSISNSEITNISLVYSALRTQILGAALMAVGAAFASGHFGGTPSVTAPSPMTVAPEPEGKAATSQHTDPEVF